MKKREGSGTVLSVIDKLSVIDNPRQPVFLRTDAPTVRRVATGIAPLDARLGGGVVVDARASYVLGGYAGSGKSTMALLWASSISGAIFCITEGSRDVWDQLSTRTQLGHRVPMFFLSDIRDVLSVAEERRPPLLVLDQLHSLAPTSADMEHARALVDYSHRSRATVLVLAEREKAGGTIRGSGSLEHLFDTVLLIEQHLPVQGGGEPRATSELERRWLTVKKTRFGPVGSTELALGERGWQGLAPAP